MSSKSKDKPDEEDSPLHQLAEFLEQAAEETGPIQVPQATIHALKKHRNRESEVAAVVRALQLPDGSNLCTRIGTLGLITLCSILISIRPCTTQWRGLFLLAEALHTIKSDSDAIKREKSSKKVAIGDKALVSIIKAFIRYDASYQTRKWMGVLVVELLDSCPHNIATLRLQSSTIHSLGQVLKHGKCQVHKLLAGFLINDILCNGANQADVWPDRADQDLFTHFPTSQFKDIQWMTSFEGFMEELGSKNALSQEKPVVIFAFALSIGDIRYTPQEDSAILVTVSDNLSIVIPATATGSAKYVDVPLQSIQSLSLDSEVHSQSQIPFHALLINSTTGPNIGGSCYVNAATLTHSTITLTFGAEQDAKILKWLIQPNEDEIVPQQQSPLRPSSWVWEEYLSARREVDARMSSLAQHFINSKDLDASLYPSEDELAVETHTPIRHQPLKVKGPSVPLSRGNQRRIRAAADTEPSDAHEAAESSVNSMSPAITGLPRKQEQNAPSHRTSLQRSQEMRPPSKISESQEVLGPDTISNAQISRQRSSNTAKRGDDTSHLSNIAKSAIEIGHGIVNGFEHTSESGLPSSMRWRKGREAIDNAPEFEGHDNRIDRQGSSGAQNAPDLGNDYDSAYDVSPETKKINGMASALASSKSPGEPLDLEQVNESRTNTRATEHPGVSHVSAPPIPPSTITHQVANKSQIKPISERRHGFNLPSHEDGSAKNAPPIKLSRRLQNGNGKVEVDILQNTKDSKPAMDNYSAGPESTRTNKSKASVPAKTKGGARKQPRVAKLGTITKSRASKNVDSRKGQANEYDFPASPQFGRAATNRAKPKEAIEAPRRNAPFKAKDPGQANGQSKKRSLEALSLKQETIYPKAVDDTDDREESMWNEDLALSNGAHDDQQKPAKNTGKKAASHAPKVKKINKPLIKSNSRPHRAPLALSRSKRPAAIRANQRIQEVDRNDEISDPEEPSNEPSIEKPKTKTSKLTTTAKDARKPFKRPINSIRKGQAKAFVPGIQRTKAHSTVGDQHHYSTQEMEVKDPQTKTDNDTGRAKDVKISKELSAIKPLHPHESRRPSLQGLDTIEPSVSPGPSPSLLGVSAKEENTPSKSRLRKEGILPSLDRTQRTATAENVPEAQDVPDEAHFSASVSALPDNLHLPEAMSMIGDTEDRYFQEALPDIADGQSRPGDSQASVADVAKSYDIKEGLTVLLGKPDGDPARKAVATQRKDPFGSKLTSMIPNITSEHPMLPDHDSTAVNHQSGTTRKKRTTAREETLNPSLSANNHLIHEEKMDKPPSAQRPSMLPVPNNQSLPQTIHKQGDKQSDNDVKTKRKASVETAIPNKKIRTPSMPASQKQSRRVGSAKIFNEKQAKAETPALVFNNRTELISWDASGPRNQGTMSTSTRNKPIYINSDKSTSSESSDPVASKSKVAPFADDPAPWEHDRLKGSHKQQIASPVPKSRHVAQMIAEPGQSVVDDKSHRFSSQSVRVTQDGSPLPVIHPPRTSLAAPTTQVPTESHSAVPDLLDEDQNDIVSHANGKEDDELQEPELPTTRNAFVPISHQPRIAPISNNNKNIPSSPHAPSVFAKASPHYVLEDGALLNGKTMKSIKSIQPQDPFIGEGEKPPSSFMAALRKSSLVEAKMKSDDKNKEHLQAGLTKRKSLAIDDDDPDKTLVEPPDKRRRVKYVAVSESSSTTETASVEVRDSDETSEQADDPDQAWHIALEPHQGDIAHSLILVVHHLVRHLVDKETAVQDLVSDYGATADRLVHTYKEERQKQLDIDKAQLSDDRTMLEGSYSKAQEKLKMLKKGVKRSHNEWTQAYQRSLKQQDENETLLAEAFALCA